MEADKTLKSKAIKLGLLYAVYLVKVVIYPLRIKLDVLHWLRLSEQNHLLNNVHLIVGIDGLMELSII